MKALLLLALACAGLAATSASAQDHGPVEVTAAIRHDALPSLRLAVPQADGYKRWHERDEHRLPLPYTPAGQLDGAVQSAARRGPLAPTFQDSVDGVGDGFTGPDGTYSVQYAPPDTVGAVGATQYVQVVNVGLAVFDKTTKTAVYGPVPTNTLWSGFGGQCETDNDGDAVVIYDHLANRWVVSQFAVGTTPYLQCVAVSQTSDATGGWYRYAFSYGSVFPDYPKMGVWPDAYYETFNMFTSTFQGAKVCAYDRSSMLTGAAATQQCFQLSSSYGGVLPSDLDGPTSPPANAPNYLLNFGSNSLNLWQFHVDWANTANTTLSSPTNLSVANFSPACGGGSCVIQPNTHQQLDSLGDRLMFRLAYRNFGDHESLVVNHSVKVGTTVKNPYTGVRWYEIRSPGSSPTVYQQSTYSPDTNFRWMGSIAMDSDGNMALGYSVSSDTVLPAVRYTGRLAGDTPSTMQAEATIVAGGGSQSGQNLDRWGDYSAMSVDPVDDCTFWFTSEYLQADGAFNWSTRIGSLKFDSCGATRQSQSISFTSTAPVGASFGGTPYTVTATATSGLAVALSIDAASTSVCALSGSTSGSQVSFIGVGTCTIDANQSGNLSYSAAPQVQQSFAVGKAAQSINFTSTAPANAVYNGSTYTVTATATSGLAVALSIDPGASTVCQLDGSTSGSHVSFIGAGTCTIDADQPGNANYSAAPQNQQSFSVAKATQSVSFTSTAPSNAVYNGSAYTVTATATSGLGVALSIDPSASTVCQLDGSASGSHVSFIGAGTCTIDADQSGNANYSAATQAQQSFAVAQATQTVSFTSTAPASAVYNGSSYTVTATATSGLAVALSIDPSASTVCQLDGSTSGSHVSFIGVGTCTIDADQSGNANYSAATQKQQTFAVSQAAQTISFDSSAPLGASAGGSAYQVLASATSGLAVTLTIDATATSVCQLDGSTSGSNVSFIGAGICRIDANQSGNANYSAASQVQQSFTVVPGPPAQLVFTTQPAAVTRGDVLATVAVTEEDAVGDVIDDNGSLVDFTVTACGGPIALGSATMVHGVATLSTTQRFYTLAAALHVDAATGALTGSSSAFAVQNNGDLAFADGFESCRL